jgi:hypothetical protein
MILAVIQWQPYLRNLQFATFTLKKYPLFRVHKPHEKSPLTSRGNKKETGNKKTSTSKATLKATFDRKTILKIHKLQTLTGKQVEEHTSAKLNRTKRTFQLLAKPALMKG